MNRRVDEVPELSPEPGWTEISTWMTRPRGTLFLSDDPAGNRVRMRFFRRDTDGAIVGKAWFGPGAEGPPGHAHGGSIMAVLDEVIGRAAWHGGRPCLAAKITVSFRRVLPLGTVAHFEAWVDRVQGKKIFGLGRLTDAHGEPFAEAEGLFVALTAERLAELGAAAVEQGPSGVATDPDAD